MRFIKLGRAYYHKSAFVIREYAIMNNVDIGPATAGDLCNMMYSIATIYCRSESEVER